MGGGEEPSAMFMLEFNKFVKFLLHCKKIFVSLQSQCGR